MSLTAEQIAEAIRLRATGKHFRLGWRKVGRIMGLPQLVIEEHFNPAVREWRSQNREIVEIKNALGMRDTPSSRIDIPRDVLFDRDMRQLLAPCSLTALVCGDPLPGMSALDRKRT